MNFPFQKLLQNKYVLYVVGILSVLNLFGYLAKQQYNTATFFIVMGLLTSFFTKNMTVILLITMGLTALFSSQRFIEGVDETLTKDVKDGEKVPEDVPVDAPTKSDAIAKAVEKKAGNQCSPLEESACSANDACSWSNNACVTRELQQQAIENTNNAGNEKPKEQFVPQCWLEDGEGTHKKGDKTYKKMDLVNGACPSKSVQCDNAKDCKAYKSLTGFTNMKNKNIVATTATASRVDGVDETVGDRIDHVETSKQAYGNLQKMLGADGMKGLASETKKLVAQQKELVNSLGQMAPVLSSAKNTLDSLNLPDMKGLQDTLTMLKGK